MQEALTLKEQQRLAELEMIRREEAKFSAYAKELDSREEAVKKERSEREEAKNKIFEKLKIEEERRRRDAEELEQLRRELHQEEFEALMRRKEQEEQEKRERQRMEMMRAER